MLKNLNLKFLLFFFEKLIGQITYNNDLIFVRINLNNKMKKNKEIKNKKILIVIYYNYFINNFNLIDFF